jgi:hypothetical protein
VAGATAWDGGILVLALIPDIMHYIDGILVFIIAM